MNKSRIYTYLIAIVFCLTMIPSIVMAQENTSPSYPVKNPFVTSSPVAAKFSLKNQYDKLTYPAATSDSGSSEYFENTVCNSLFSSDPNNIFRTIFCSLIRIASTSIADFSSNITCSIQTIGTRGNYFSDLSFGFDENTTNPQKGCVGGPSGSTPSPQRNDLFGTPSDGANPGTGFYNNAPSALSNSIIGQDPNQKSSVQSGFDITKNIVSVIAFIALLVFAFANILHIDINTYAIKKALPALVIAIVGAWLAIYIIYMLSRSADFLYRVPWFSPYQAINPMQNIFGGIFDIPAASSVSAAGGNMSVLNQSARLLYSVGGMLLGGSGVEPKISFISGVFGSLLLLIPAIVVFAFEYVMALRPFAVGILTIMAPLAFGCLILPQTQKYFRLWWSILLIAIFYAPFANFIFFILNTIAGPGAYAGTAGTAGGIALVAIILFKTAVIFFLVRLPFAFEHDLKTITAKLANTSFGASLGLPRTGVGAQEQKPSQKQPNPTVADNILATQEAKSIIAGTNTNLRVNLRNTLVAKKTDNLRADPTLIRGIVPQLPKLLENANQTNITRTTPLLVKSTADLSPDAFKAIISQSDLKLWRNSGLIQELKNQRGQILDNQGAAIRADSARKLVRLAQITENGKVANPEALKLLAEKGALNNVPLPIIKSAIDEKVLSMPDLFPTYKNQSQRIYEKVQSLEQSKETISRSTNSTTVKTLMEQDRKDFETGFKDMTKMFGDIVRDSRIIPPPPPETIRKIVSEMRNTDNGVFDKNGPYFLKRLSDVSQNATKSIASTMQNEGVNPQTSIAIAHNPRIDFESAKKYMPSSSKPESIAFLREGFINRDLSTGLTQEVAANMVAQKTMIGQSISQKLSDALKKDPSSSLENVKVNVDDAAEKLASPSTLSAEDFKKAVSQVDQFYPGALLKTNGEMNPEDVAEVTDRAKNVSEVISTLQNAGVDEKTITTNPSQANKTIAEQIKESVSKTLAENTSVGAQFSQKLNGAAAQAPKADLKGA